MDAIEHVEAVRVDHVERLRPVAVAGMLLCVAAAPCGIVYVGARRDGEVELDVRKPVLLRVTCDDSADVLLPSRAVAGRSVAAPKRVQVGDASVRAPHHHVFELLVLHAVAVGQNRRAAGMQSIDSEPVAIEVHCHAGRKNQRTVNRLVLRQRPVFRNRPVLCHHAKRKRQHANAHQRHDLL